MDSADRIALSENRASSDVSGIILAVRTFD